MSTMLLVDTLRTETVSTVDQRTMFYRKREPRIPYRTAKPWSSRTIKTRILRMFQLFYYLEQRLKRRLTTEHEPIFGVVILTHFPFARWRNGR